MVSQFGRACKKKRKLRVKVCENAAVRRSRYVNVGRMELRTVRGELYVNGELTEDVDCFKYLAPYKWVRMEDLKKILYTK